MPSKQVNMVLIDEAGDSPVVLRPGVQSKKRLFTIFFNNAGPLMVDVLSDKTTMTSRLYTGTVLPKVVAAVQEQRPNVGTTRTLLLHDNAAPSPQSNGHSSVSGGRKVTSPAPPTSMADHWLFSTFKTSLAEKIFFTNSRLQER